MKKFIYMLLVVLFGFAAKAQNPAAGYSLSSESSETKPTSVPESSTPKYFTHIVKEAPAYTPPSDSNSRRSVSFTRAV